MGTPVSALPEVVVTGGLGFIGSHVVDAYLAAGHRVRIIDSAVGAVTEGREYEDDPRCQVFRVSVEEYLCGGGRRTGRDPAICGPPWGGHRSIDVVCHRRMRCARPGAVRLQLCRGI